MKGAECGIEGGGIISAVVVTVTVDVFAVTPSAGVTDAGDAVHVPSFSAGALVQVEAHREVKPPTGVTVTVIGTCEPFFTVAVAGAVTVKSAAVFVPAPVSEIICGLVLSPSVSSSVAVSAPTTDGLNVTLTVH